MDRISRRRFLEDSAALLAVTAVPSQLAALQAPSGRKLGPNDQIRIACIGVHGQGLTHVSAYAAMKDVTIAAICDADTATFANAVKIVTDHGRPAPDTVQDIRKLLERKDIDAVSIATPNHWHALAAVWAMQAGKDVYVEKPICHEVQEGRSIVRAARRYGRICQCGTQCRSSKGLQEAVAYLHSDKMGKIRLARGLCYKTRGSIGLAGADSTPPSTVDYDLWLGPAPMKPVHRTRFHYDWHWFWDYGNGDLGNQGIHEMDKARWGLGKKGLPKSVLGLGGRFGYVDDGQTPNTELIFMDYGDAQLIFEVRGLVKGMKETERDWLNLNPTAYKVGNVFYGEKGTMVMPSYSDAVVFDKDGNKVTEFHGGGNHHRNFIDAMRSRRASDLNADCEEGHLSSALCHLGNISYKLGEMAPFNPRTGAFGDNREAIETYGRFEDHLVANGLKLDAATYRLGRKLTIASGAERFAGDAEANALLTRPYRAGYVVPEKP